MRIHKRYPSLVAVVRYTHIKNGDDFHAHDFMHAMRVAWMCERIAEDPEVGRLAAIAGLCHNADRILQKIYKVGPSVKIGRAAIIQLCTNWLTAEPCLSAVEFPSILDAVLGHGDINRDDDSPVMIAIKDADRLINMAADGILRNVQYITAAKPGVPVVDPIYLIDTPGQTFRNPGSILSSFPLTYEDWVKQDGRVCIRLPKAREIAEKRIEVSRRLVRDVLEQLELEEIDQSVFA